MLEPATKANAEEAAVLAVPLVAPPAVRAAIDIKVVAELEIVMLFAPVARLIPAPAASVIEPVEPLSADTTLALAAGAGTEIVTLPAPTPTEAMPAPENCKEFENVPVLLEVVLPSANIEIEDVWMAGEGTEIVTDPAPTPTEAIPAPEKLSRVLKEPEELEVVLPSAVRERVWID